MDHPIHLRTVIYIAGKVVSDIGSNAILAKNVAVLLRGLEDTYDIGVMILG